MTAAGNVPGLAMPSPPAQPIWAVISCTRSAGGSHPRRRQSPRRISRRSWRAPRLPENAMARGRAPGMPTCSSSVNMAGLCALVHSCSHLGGPLSEGTLNDGSVVCPWHRIRVRAVATARCLNGPATSAQPCLRVRERDGHTSRSRRSNLSRRTIAPGLFPSDTFASGRDARRNYVLRWR